MTNNAFSYWQAPPHWLQISSLDCHTGGEPLRIITAGFPELRGSTVLEQRRDCQQRFDHLRTALMFEPRGHADMYGCIIVPPERSSSAFGVLFIHNEGYSTMCGHAMIALAKTAVEAGVVPVTYPVTEFLVDAPCGQIRLFAQMTTGDPVGNSAGHATDDPGLSSASSAAQGKDKVQVHRCWFENVPSFVLGSPQHTEVAGIGRVPYQLAYGGAFYAYVDAQAIDLDLSMANHRQIIRYGERIKQQLLADEVSVTHPFSEDLSFLYGVIFTGAAQTPGVYQRNVCIFANGELDRSPTGSGVSGLVALLHHQGRLEPGEKIRIESIVGSEFEVSVKAQTRFGTYQAVIPQVAGTAHVTGQHQFLIDPADPLQKVLYSDEHPIPMKQNSINPDFSKPVPQALAGTTIKAPAPEFSERLQRFRYQMLQAGQDAALIFSTVNLRYLFNYSGEALMAVVTQEQAVLITDYRFIAQAEQECKAVCPTASFFCRDRDRQTLGQAIALQLTAAKSRRVWFEDSDISVLLWRTICEDNGLIEFSPCPPHLAAQRVVKDDWEVAQIEQAAAIADLALARALPMLQVGVSEREFATELEYQLKKAGAEDFSFATILGFAARSALPHALPTDKRLKKGDLVVLDFGAVVNGYRSDMTRSFVCGKASPLQQQMYQVVLEAQQAALEAVRAGISGAALNTIAANILAASPFAKDAGPGLGHGVGLQLHEQPFLGPLCQQLLPQNAVITIEPGIYIADFGGVRIEDDVLVTKTGCRILTKAAKTFELALRE